MKRDSSEDDFGGSGSDGGLDIDEGEFYRVKCNILYFISFFFV